jgi:hypothetical protein
MLCGKKNSFTRADSIFGMIILEVSQIVFDDVMRFIIPMSNWFFQLLKRFKLVDPEETLLNYRREIVR